MDKLDSIEDQITYATKNDENLYSFIWIEAILKPLKKLYTSRNEQELLFYMDRLLQIYHHNGNLADMIILGGVNTLNKINTMSYKGIVLPGNVSEGIENDLHVISTPQNVSIMYRHPSSHKSSIASIDNIGDFWWISRVLVSDKNMRRQGIGSILLRRAVQEVLKHDPKARIVVEPSGYDLKTEDQVRFYTKNGFIPLEGHPGGFIYNNQND